MVIHGEESLVRSLRALSRSIECLEYLHHVETDDQTEDIRFSDDRVLAFFQSLNLGGCCCFAANFFLLSPAPIQANTRGGDQKM